MNTLLDPHLNQLAIAPIIEGDFTINSRILSKDAPRSEYVHIKKSSSLHWGQRKLLLSEIEFLTMHGDKSNTLVYAGAAGGYHIPFLSAMFPHHVMHLYDPAKFEIKSGGNLHIHNEKMTDDIAESYNKTPVLFVSDIRTVETPKEGNDDPVVIQAYADAIARDNSMQLSWSQKMNAIASMVKFKLPYSNVDGKNYTNYPAGDIFLPVWGKKQTTESRLIYTNPNKMQKYIHKKYEEQMAYFNIKTRLSYYIHDYDIDSKWHPVGIDHCYSCRSELYILEEYVKKYYKFDNTDIKMALVRNLSESMSSHLGRVNFTLANKPYD